MNSYSDNKPIVSDLSDIEELEKKPLSQFVKAQSVYDLIKKAAEEYGEKKAFIYLPDGLPGTEPINVSYRELLEGVTKSANLFHHVGCGPENSIAILAPNIPEAQFALWGAETVSKACPVNFMLDTSHIIEIIEKADVKTIVALGADPELPILQKIKEISDATGIQDIFIIDTEEGSLQGVKNFSVEREKYSGKQLSFKRELSHSTPAALFHTGGTTGVPKLAMHLQGNQLFTSYCAALYYDLKEEDTVINGFPVFHVAGTFVYGTSCFTAGATQVLTTRTGYRNIALMNSIWTHINDYKVTVFACVPTILATLLQTEKEDTQGASLRAFYTGGSPLSSELADAIEKKFSVPVRNIFGMTECAGLLALEPFHSARTPGAAGYRLPYTKINAFNMSENGVIDTAKPCKSGEIGVIAIRGPNVGPGYTDNQRNAGTFQDGWLISGDLGYVDEDGKVFVIGREKDVIIRGAHNIDPASIEEAFNSHPAIAICAAVGQPDIYAGEIPVVYAELNDKADISVAELIDFASPLIPEPAARPRRVEFVKELPKTAIGKIYKPQIRCWAAEYSFKKTLSDAGFRGQVNSTFETGQIIVRLKSDNSVSEQQMSVYKKALQNYTLKYEFCEN